MSLERRVAAHIKIKGEKSISCRLLLISGRAMRILVCYGR
jgi:hypothetical protein